MDTSPSAILEALPDVGCGGTEWTGVSESGALTFSGVGRRRRRDWSAGLEDMVSELGH